MRVITWNLQIERNAVNRTFSGRNIIAALNWISRYWAVNFVQVTNSNPQVRFLLTNQRRAPSVAAWVSGRTVYIPSSFQYVSADQQVYVMAHEVGHVLGGSRHSNNPLDVMFASITDVQKNFAIGDPNWFRFNWRSNLRPWHEPDYRRTRLVSAVDESCEVGCGDWSPFQWWRDLVTAKHVVEVDE